MGALMLALLFGGIALAAASKRKQDASPAASSTTTSPGQPAIPDDEEPADPGFAAQEAIQAAQQAAAAAAAAAQQAIQAAAQGNQQSAQQKADEAASHAETGARAADAAAPTPGAAAAVQAAQAAGAAAVAAAQAAGIPIPDSLKPTATGGAPTSTIQTDEVLVTSPGLPPIVVNDAQAAAAAGAAIEPTKAPPVPPIAPNASLPAEETKPENDPNGTIALARLLLERETQPQWRESMKDAVKTWQAKTGLLADGEFGVKGALRMAQEVGIVPLVRFWPAGSAKATALADYRARLRTLAAGQEAKGPDGAAHGAALRASAAVEDARSYGNPNAPPLPSAQRAATRG